MSSVLGRCICGILKRIAGPIRELAIPNTMFRRYKKDRETACRRMTYLIMVRALSGLLTESGDIANSGPKFSELLCICLHKIRRA